MATFEIYKYSFKNIAQGNLFSKETRNSALDDAQRIFGEVLKDKLSVSKKKRDGEITLLENEIEHREDDIMVMILCNEKSVRYREKKDDKTLTSHPGCRILIDNRPGVGQMAIERDDSFNSNPDAVRKLLQEAINKRISEYRLEVEINAKKRASEFWEMVEEQTHIHKDAPTRVVFSFPKNETTPIDATPNMKAYLDASRVICKAMNAVKASMNMEADKNQVLRLERTKEDLANMVSLCSQNGYDISVHFKHYGVYRFGKTVRALFEMKDSVLTDFVKGQKTCEGGMLQWLDDIRMKVEGFEDEEPVKKTRKRSRQE